MSSKTTATSGRSIGLVTLVTGILVAGKVFGSVTYSWWVAFAPVLVSVGLSILLLGVLLLLPAVLSVWE